MGNPRAPTTDLGHEVSGASVRAPDVQLENITRRFAATLANDGIDLHLRPATIHALVGENGAGKSTLMRILYGLVQPDGGRIRVDHRPTILSSPAQALGLGIGMIHQHFMLVPVMTVLENIVLGTEGLRGLRAIPKARLAETLNDLFDSYGFDLDPHARVDALGVGGRQRVEIARLLFRGARLLICDEPTAVLAPPEVASLFRILRRLREEGRTVVFITHKLAEVIELADSVTVLRRGRVVGEMKAGEICRDKLVQWIMGEDPCAVTSVAEDARSEPEVRPHGEEVVLAAEHLGLRDPQGRALLGDVSFRLRAGEILGVAGVAGNGQRELADVVAGRCPFTAGTLSLGAARYAPGQTVPAQERPALIPEDRTSEGLIGDFRLWENLLLGRQRGAPFMRPLGYTHAAARDWARPQLERFRVEPPDPQLPANALSGGNQQKLLCAREIARARGLLVACQPTRGIDIASTRLVHATLRRFRDLRGSVLLVSADLDEILELSDRVAVIYRGRLGAPVARGQVNLEALGRAMVGVSG